MNELVDSIAPDELKAAAKDAFNGLDVAALTQENFLDLVSVCGCRCISKCPNDSPVVEMEGFVMELAVQLWKDKHFQTRCPVRELLSRMRVSSEFGPRECAFMTKYFYYFGKMRSHEGMMNDLGRTETYRKAILGNPDNFKGKVVMDVGSGSGLLAFFAIQAGAEKVYAVEASCMHEVITQLARANGWGGKVVVVNKVLQDMTESDCPLNSVDTIIAETLGTFLFGERGIETMLVARDRFLKDGGAIFPTRATLSMAPFSDKQLFDQQATRPIFWTGTDFYGINLSSCYDRAHRECMSQVVASMVDPGTLVATQHDVVYDFRTIDSAALRNIQVPYRFVSDKDCEVHGLAGWFVAEFLGSNETVRLSTAPFDTLTHWFQVRFLISEALVAKQGEILRGSMDLKANEQQSYTCSFEMVLESAGGPEKRLANADMSLMDLDSSLKEYCYKVVKHGDMSVACVDWQKTTEEAMQRRKPVVQSSSGHIAKEVALGDAMYVCVNAPVWLTEIKLKRLEVVGKTGNATFSKAGGDVSAESRAIRAGLIRQEDSGEESFWMEKSAYTTHMIEVIVSRKTSLQQDFQTKPDNEVISHFRKLSDSQVRDCFEALNAMM